MRQFSSILLIGLITTSLGACSAAPDDGAIDVSSHALSAASEGQDSTAASFGRGHRGHDDDCRHPPAISVTPNDMGFIDASSNALGIQGSWYPFADGYGLNGQHAGSCQAAGHADSECSIFTTPDPGAPGFPNEAGRMCAAGTVAQVLLLADGTPDWGNMWGAGIGFDLDFTGGDINNKGSFDAPAHGVVGVSFDIDQVPPLGLRVEFPTPTTAGTGIQPYWGAAAFYPNSPLAAGSNVVYFTEVQTPEATPQPLDTAHIQSVQFYLPAYTTTSEPFQFCLSNVKFLLGR